MKHEVRLGFGSLTRGDGILDADEVPVTASRHQHMSQVDDAGEMPGPYRGHLHYLSVNELHPVVLGKQPGLPHPVILPDGEALRLHFGRQHVSLMSPLRASAVGSSEL